MHRGLQYAPGQETAFLPVGRQANAKQLQHIVSVKLLELVNRLALDLLHQHGGGRLADATAITIEPSRPDTPIRADFELDTNHVTAEGIVVFVGVRECAQCPRW